MDTLFQSMNHSLGSSHLQTDKSTQAMPQSHNSLGYPSEMDLNKMAGANSLHGNDQSLVGSNYQQMNQIYSNQMNIDFMDNGQLGNGHQLQMESLPSNMEQYKMQYQSMPNNQLFEQAQCSPISSHIPMVANQLQSNDQNKYAYLPPENSFQYNTLPMVNIEETSRNRSRSISLSNDAMNIKSVEDNLDNKSGFFSPPRKDFVFGDVSLRTPSNIERSISLPLNNGRPTFNSKPIKNIKTVHHSAKSHASKLNNYLPSYAYQNCSLPKSNSHQYLPRLDCETSSQSLSNTNSSSLVFSSKKKSSSDYNISQYNIMEQPQYKATIPTIMIATSSKPATHSYGTLYTSSSQNNISATHSMGMDESPSSYDSTGNNPNPQSLAPIVHTVSNHMFQPAPVDYSSFKDKVTAATSNVIPSSHSGISFTFTTSCPPKKNIAQEILTKHFMGHSSKSVPQKSLYREKRRVCHINAEQKRRCNIKNGFDTLASLLPSLNAGSNNKVSKAAMLQKAAEHIRVLLDDKLDQQKEYDLLKRKVEKLNQTIR